MLELIRSPGVLYFNTMVAGTTQSFKTVFNNVITGKVDKNIVTLGLGVGNSHSLRENDNIIVSIKPNDTISVDVRYNSYNRRMVFDPQGFTHWCRYICQLDQY